MTTVRYLHHQWEVTIKHKNKRSQASCTVAECLALIYRCAALKGLSVVAVAT